ncbi:efflux RND transporter periplasmic adaptor subunit [Pedobacter psychrodurus]|jgi:membrane fusion protein (multidrug efflux system)|uniref:efflux RND transporter periplasmic adaptor subunit n=1 Tax=Pedobacter psychrodurus TaxID=2530456 RepID=UPI002930A5E2|nr:efflux RND transporter periplasmic adaptor subunit [Pedobacter psychrodurus]
MKTKYVLIAIAVILIGIVVYQLSANKKEINSKKNKSTLVEIKIPVKVAQVVQQEMEISINKTGVLAPFREVKALSITSGTIREVRFKLGDQVAQGQVLALLDDRLLRLELQKAQSAAAKLKNDLDTYTELLRGKAATQEKVNQLNQDYLDAKNLVAQASKNLGDAVIKAPNAGTISVKSVEEGLYVPAGTEIATIINLSQAKVLVNLTESEVYKVKNGQKIKITTDVYPDREFQGTISFISPQADQTNNYPVEIMVANATREVLRSGTFVYADFSRKTSQQIIVIPREALTEGVKNASVYVVSNGIAKLRKIEAGSEIGDKIQVVSGLQPGEVVVTSGQINLKEGSEVSISK